MKQVRSWYPGDPCSLYTGPYSSELSGVQPMQRNDMRGFPGPVLSTLLPGHPPCSPLDLTEPYSVQILTYTSKPSTCSLLSMFKSHDFLPVRESDTRQVYFGVISPQVTMVYLGAEKGPRRDLQVKQII